MRVALLVLALLGSALASAAAQIPDSARVDSVRADTTDYSELFLKTYAEGRERVPVFPRLGSPGLLPVRSRIVLDRDSLEWHNAETVSDVLSKVPGVYVWRGGWIGRPEPINFQGRGASSTEFLIDGAPYLALGVDSVAVDPSILPLTFFDRIEVERLPGLLRVHLFTRRHDRLPPRTRVGVASGDFDIARYIASLEKRSRGGFGFVVAAEHLAVPLRTGDQGAYSNTQYWLQATWVPPKKPFRAMAQLIRGGPTRGDVREVLPGEGAQQLGDTLSQGIDGSRTDFHANLVYQPGAEGLGFRAVATAGYSAWREDSTAYSLGGADGHVRYLDQSVWQLGGQLGYRTRTTSLEAGGWYRSRWTPVEVRGSFGAAPTGPVAINVEGVMQRHGRSRGSKWLTGRAGLELPLGFQATAMVRAGNRVANPSVLTEASVGFRDLAGLLSFEKRRLAAEIGYWRTDRFAPERFPLYRAIDSIGPSEPTDWVTVSARIAPLQWLIFDGWYSNPVGANPEGQPPTHSIVNATIMSRFLPTFRSGIFGLKLQGSMETWGTGVIGRDAEGEPITLRGATLFRAQIQLKIGDFVAFYDRANVQATRLGYLPGLMVLRLASTFGVRWEFSN